MVHKHEGQTKVQPPNDSAYPGPYLQVADLKVDDAKYIQKRAGSVFNSIVKGDQAAKNDLINAAMQGAYRDASPGDTQPQVIAPNFDDSQYANQSVIDVVAAFNKFRHPNR
jgi:O-acetylhomoserine/O-acetylserine sulfhydrylase-like pyridoxal-dependent enzyme